MSVQVCGTPAWAVRWIEHLVWTSILLFLLTQGGGALSIDRPIARGYRIV